MRERQITGKNTEQEQEIYPACISGGLRNFTLNISSSAAWKHQAIHLTGPPAWLSNLLNFHQNSPNRKPQASIQHVPQKCLTSSSIYSNLFTKRALGNSPGSRAAAACGYTGLYTWSHLSQCCPAGQAPVLCLCLGRPWVPNNGFCTTTTQHFYLYNIGRCTFLKSSVTFFREDKLTAAGLTEKFDTEFLTKIQVILGYENMLWKKKRKLCKIDYSASCLSGYIDPGGNSGPSCHTEVDEQVFFRAEISLLPLPPRCAPEEPQSRNCRT